MNAPRTDTQFLISIAQKLKLLRKERHLSQMQVTMDTGINVSRAESGKRSLPILSVAILCNYYDVTLEDFFKDLSPNHSDWI